MAAVGATVVAFAELSLFIAGGAAPWRSRLGMDSLVNPAGWSDQGALRRFIHVPSRCVPTCDGDPWRWPGAFSCASNRQHRAMNGSSEPLKSQASRKAELERLRRELLRRIVQNEAQRRAAALSAGRK